MTTTTQIPAPTDTRSATPRPVVWVELPHQPNAGSEADERMPFYDAATTCEDCERWDGMA